MATDTQLIQVGSLWLKYRPIRTVHALNGRWDCCECRQFEIFRAGPNWDDEIAMTFAKLRFWRHAMQTHPERIAQIYLDDRRWWERSAEQ